MSKREHIISSHGKKNDKETQSPKLKIFNDIMQIDNLDMEKNNQPVPSSGGPENAANNTMDSTGNNMNNFNRNINGGSKPFVNNNTVNTTANGNGNVMKKKSRTRKKSPERSTSGSPKRPKKKAEKNFEEPVVTTNNIENQTLPLQNEKSFADKFWKQCNQPECKQTEDTFSCVSCALKKIASSEHACIGCLIVLFVVSLVLAVMVVCRTTLLAPEDEWAGTNSDELKKRIEKVKEGNRIKEEFSGIRGVRSHWRDKSVPFNGLTDDAAFGPNLRDMNTFDESESKVSGYLSSILDPDKTSEFQNNERLREFYRKLLQADVQIQNLKKFDGMVDGVNTDELEFTSNRKKRSLRARFRNNKRRGKVVKGKKINKTEVLPPVGKNRGDHVQRFKRNNNISEEPLSFIIEKKKIVVQIKPKNSKKVPKCSHAPKDSHTHEKLLKHPFYKNTQRLDEWLDVLLSKDIPNVLSDTFTLNEFLTQGKNMHPDINDVKSFKSQSTDIGEKFDKNILSTEVKGDKVSDYLKILDTDTIYTPDSTTELSEYSALMKQYSEVPTDKGLSSTPNYDMEFSTSGINTESTTAQSPWHQSLLDRVPNIRRLMQLNEEGNEFGYEDFDDENQHELGNRLKDRSKRMEDTPSHMDEYKTANQSNINNPNWKGPMPLYPDELSVMAKHALNSKNNEFKRSTDVSTATNIPRIEVNMADSYQDYLNKRFDNIEVARMAQDYSDYGVLNEKKEYVKNEKHSLFGDKKDRYKFSFDDKTDSKRGPPLRPESEGVKFKFLSAPPKPKEHFDDFSKVDEVLDIPESNSGIGSFEEHNLSKSNSSDKTFSKMLENHFKIINVKSVGANGLKQIMKQDELLTRNSWNPDDSWMLMKKFNTKRKLLSLNMALIKRQNASAVETKTINNYGSDSMSNNTTDNQQKNEKESITSAEKYELENITKPFRNISTWLEPNETTAKYDIQGNLSDIDDLPIVLFFNDDDLNRNDSTAVVEGIYSDTKNNFDIPDGIKKPTSFKRDILNLTSVFSGNLDANNANINQNLNKNVTTNETSISDVFAAISNLFAALDGVEILFPHVNMRPSIMDTVAGSNNMTTINSTSNTYPLYATEELENIGHRTRVLLSVNENTVNRTNENIVINNIQILNHTEVLPESGSNISHKLEDVVKAQNTSNLVSLNNTNIRDMREVNKENKTIVKRNADDSNLIFWNDIYDDEYGVETDRLDDAVRDKHSVKGKGFIKKSGKWVQDKIKKFADNIIKSSASTPGTGKKRSIRDAISLNGVKTFSQKVLSKSKRQAKTTAELAFDNQKSAFAALTMNMKEICKKAAEAVHQTKHVREKPKEESLSTSLMQQLLSLMNDLVDYQVQQKTCAKLPPDLQSFLDWLTAPQEDPKALLETTVTPIDFPVASLNAQSLNAQLKYKDKGLNNKAQHLVALKDVQDLIKQYHDMNDDEKSKIVGIESYLDSQKKYLDRQIYGYSDIDINNLVTAQERIGRSVPNAKQRQLKRKPRSFKPDTSIKITNVTANFDGGNITTQQVSVVDNGNDAVTNKREFADKDSNQDKDVKRNLQDVYYRAVTDSKKHTVENAATQGNLIQKNGMIENIKKNKGKHSPPLNSYLPLA